MIWEPGLPISLKNSGIDYVFLEDSYLKLAGARGGNYSTPALPKTRGRLYRSFL